MIIPTTILTTATDVSRFVFIIQIAKSFMDLIFYDFIKLFLFFNRWLNYLLPIFCDAAEFISSFLVGLRAVILPLSLWLFFLEMSHFLPLLSDHFLGK